MPFHLLSLTYQKEHSAPAMLAHADLDLGKFFKKSIISQQTGTKTCSIQM